MSRRFAVAQPVLKPTSMRVLIAEDTDSVRVALRILMEHLGHQVVGIAVDGEDALSQYREHHPDIVLMDVRMPGMDGLTCTSLLATQDPNAKVVILTAGRSTEADARRAGARALVEKPFDLSELANVMHAVAAA